MDSSAGRNRSLWLPMNMSTTVVASYAVLELRFRGSCGAYHSVLVIDVAYFGSFSALAAPGK